MNERRGCASPTGRPAAESDASLGGVIFDCDGTLVDTMPLHFRAWRQALQATPLEFEEALFYELGGVPSTAIVQILNDRFHMSLDPDAIAGYKEKIFMDLLPQAQPIPQVIDLVYEYAGRYPMAVASGGLRSIVIRILDALGITHLFQVIATAEDVVHGKPAPDLFLFAARGLGVAPDRCLVYEDSPLGLEAARRAGMKGIDIRSLPELSSAARDTT